MFKPFYLGDFMVYTLTLSPSLDYILNVPSLSFDDINRASDTQITFGGKGVNVSFVLNQLGVDNVAMGFVSGDFGAKFLSLVAQAGITADFCTLSQGEMRVNVKIRSNIELDVNANNAPFSHDDLMGVVDKLKGQVKSGDFVVLSGSVPRAEIYADIMSALQGRGVNFVVDAQGDALVNTLKYRPYLIKPNHHELGEIVGKVIATTNDALDGAKILAKMGAQNVLVSMAEKGAVLLTDKGDRLTCQNAKGTLINSTGCGDSMVAGFVAGIIQGKNYSQALALATASGNATAFSQNLATKDKIFSCISNNTVL